MNDPGPIRGPLPWMSDTIDLGKEQNVFEIRVTEYRSGAMLGRESRPEPPQNRP